MDVTTRYFWARVPASKLWATPVVLISQLFKLFLFGFNFGNYSVSNGSLMFGGWYDSNRIASSSWILLPDSTNNSGFLDVGKLDVESTYWNGSTFNTTNVTLDFNNPKLEFPFWDPTWDYCTENSFSFKDAQGKSVNITIPLDLADTDCITEEANPSLSIPALGWPFFRAAYVYVDENGKAYIAAANYNDRKSTFQRKDPQTE